MSDLGQTQLIEDLCDRFMLAQEATELPKGKFAERVGLTSQQMSNIKKYRNPPPHGAILKAIKEFGFTADWFYVGAKVGFRDGALADRLRDAEAKAESRKASHPK
jgi:hypothetical protein